MNLSSGRVSGAQSGTTTPSLSFAWILVSARRTVATVLATMIVFATIGIVFSAGPARADTTFATGQVLISVGFGEVDVYDPASGNQLNALVDSTNSQYTAGTAFDANGNLFVADGTTGNISEFSPSGAPMGIFASGLANPAALVFDRAGNLYVGQVRSNYIAAFSPNGQRMPDIGPLKTQLFGDDWIDLSSDQCTFYYTSERSAVMAYNMCTKSQLPDFTQQPLAGPAAYELRILPNSGTYSGDVLVADSDRVVLLDSSGNVSQTYACASLPGCGPPDEVAGQLYGLALDPNGTSFWVSDPFSGLVWEVDIATGAVQQVIDSQAAYLYGLSVGGQVTAATASTTVVATPTSVTIQPLTTPLQYGTPTTVSAVVTDTATTPATPIANEPVVFSLSGGGTCTANSDSTGTATCVITPSEPEDTYTLSATFDGDSSQSTPIGSSTESQSVPVNPEEPSVTYTGPTTGVNGQPITLTGTLTTPPGDTPLPPGQQVTFTVGSGSTAQSCPGQVDASGNATCTLTLDQPVSDVSITATYGGQLPYVAPVTSSSTSATITEPTILTVHSATGDYGDVTKVTAKLTDASNNAIANENVTLIMNNNNNNSESCSALSDANGLAQCSITPSEPQGTYSLSGSFAGDASLPLQLTGSTGSSKFVVTLEETTLTYTGATVANNGQPLAVSGVLTSDGASDTDGDAGSAAPIAGRTVTFVLGSGTSAQSCNAVTDSTGTAKCSIASVEQSPGPIPVTDTFAGDNWYQTASASSTVNLPEGTQLVINPATGTYNGPTTLSGTLTNTYTDLPVSGEPVTFTINGTQSCTADTGTNGFASCTLSPNEPSGTYSFTGSFPGDTTSMPQLLSSGSTSTITVNPAPTTLTYSGTTSVTNGQPATFSGTITSSNPTSGTDVSGATVTFTIGSGGSVQSCTGTSNANGYVTCTIPSVNQTSGTVAITGGFSGNDYYGSTSVASSATVHTPTTLTVSDTPGPNGTPILATYGAPTTLTGDLTNSVNGQPVPNQPVTLTLNGTQSCTAITNANGVASCIVTPNEPAGTYSLSASFGGESWTPSQPGLNPSGGSNSVVVTKAPTTATYTSPSIVVNGWSTTLTANVGTSFGSGLTGQPVTLTVGSGSSAQSCTGNVDASGKVSCTIASLNQTSGTLPVTVSYNGNSYYQSSSKSSTVIVASAPSSGGFVVGDVSAGATTSSLLSGTISNGNTVNFWGSQLWKKNVFTGVNNSPASMKGYIDQGPVLGPQACTKQWTSDPGNSSNPPATIPNYMLVVVSSFINQNASTEWGDIKHIAVVHVTPGYGPAPGHDGFGQIVGWIC